MGLDMYLNKKVYRYRKSDGTFTSDINSLTFDKDGKHTVFGNFPEWVTVDEKH